MIHRLRRVPFLVEFLVVIALGIVAWTLISDPLKPWRVSRVYFSVRTVMVGIFGLSLLVYARHVRSRQIARVGLAVLGSAVVSGVIAAGIVLSETARQVVGGMSLALIVWAWAAWAVPSMWSWCCATKMDRWRERKRER